MSPEMTTVEWPRVSLMSTRSPPAALMRVAAPWRPSCRPTGGRPALRAQVSKRVETRLGCQALPSGWRKYRSTLVVVRPPPSAGVGRVMVSGQRRPAS